MGVYIIAYKIYVYMEYIYLLHFTVDIAALKRIETYSFCRDLFQNNLK